MKVATLVLAIATLMTTVGFGAYHLFRNKKNKGKMIIYKE